MPSIQIFDPALCCSTGVCGVEVDQNLVNFAADVDWAKQHGAQCHFQKATARNIKSRPHGLF